MSKQTRVVAKVINEDVYVRLTDIIRVLNADNNGSHSASVKEYIENSIENWEDYENSILEEYHDRF